MSTERINKLQPDRTFYLRGFTGFGAAASLCETSPDSFNVYGVFRDQADFCVLVIYDADNIFEHYTVKYLPDFDLSGMVLNFNLNYQKLQPIDSAKYSWIDWAQLDVIDSNGKPSQVRVWDHATLSGGSYSVAQGTYVITAPGGCTQYDRLTLFVNNASFDFVAFNGGESAVSVAETFASSINSYNWSTFASSSVSVIASADANGNLTLKNARTGLVDVNGVTVNWNQSAANQNGAKFPGIAAGSTLYLGGTAYTVAAVNSPTSLTLTSPAPAATGVFYLAEYAGVDGNDVTVYMVVRPGNETLAVNNHVLQLSGGNSDDVTWNISLDFSALGIDQVRQAWLTFAPQLAAGAPYLDSEWTAAFSNWSVTDPKGLLALQCAGPGSVRIGNGDPGSTYAGSGWSMLPANNYWRGFGRVTNQSGDSVTVSYQCQSTHDLYLGTSLFSDRGIVGVTLDGEPLPQLDCFLNVSSEVVTRRILKTAVPPGSHQVAFTLLSANHQALGAWDIHSTGTKFLFDYLEAAIPSDIPDAAVTYGNVSPALDFDTDATYKVSPQRLLWHLTKLGFSGQLNEYLGVFWWNQRTRVGATWNSAVISVAGNWLPGDSAQLDIYTVDPATGQQTGFPFLKTVTQWDTSETIASHFVYYINAASVAMWAETTVSGQLTIHTRTPNWGDKLSVTANSAAGTITVNPGTNIHAGSDGTWQIDTSTAAPINFPVTQWHADLFRAVKAAGLLITTSFSMELVNPPDDGTPANVWVARYADGTPVTTDTGFSHLSSSQCAPIPNLTNYQKLAYIQMAGLQNAAGLTPWLQFGEFLWWYFSATHSIPIGYLSYTSPISVGLATPHGFSTGDRVVISGAQGMTSANGTWPITVTDNTHFTLNGSSANGAWIAGSGTVSGGSMGYYDPVTTAAANSALGRPLYSFTCQDDDPSVNGGADVAFLAEQLQAHVNAIRQAVLASCPGAKFEILYPNDVNNPVCNVSASNPYPQGGRLNAAVNLPATWRSKSASGFDRFKVEALSWGATYLDLNRAIEAVAFAFTGAMQWSNADIAYLIPWFNGVCPWPVEYQAASALGLGLVNFWAYDHLALMSWPLPFPSPIRRSFFGG